MESGSTFAWIALAVSLASITLVMLVEVCLLSVKKERIEWLITQNVRGALALGEFSLNPTRAIGTISPIKYILLAVGLLAGMVLSFDFWGPGWWPTSLITLLIMVLIGIIHVLAKTLASFFGEPVALRTCPLIWNMSRVLRPLFSAGTFFIDRLQPRDIYNSNNPTDSLPQELSLSMGPDGKPLDEREVRMIRGVVHLDNTTAREIMVPRVDMIVADMGTPLDKLAKLMTQSGHSRIPVFEGDLDHIQGIAYAMDILSYLGRDIKAPTVLTPEYIRPAQFIPESKTLEDLLNDIQRRRVHMAIVVDEYGGVSGLVTIEDLLEEIVGEIQDEFDVGEPAIETLSDTEFLIDARTSIDQLDELFGISVEGNGFDTVGGFVYQRLGKIPSSGNVVEYNGLRIEVVSTIGRRIKRLRITRST